MKYDYDYKMNQAKKHGVCKVCLKVANHKESNCDGKYKTCLVCKEPHNTNLHARKDSYPMFQKLKEKAQWHEDESRNIVDPTSSKSKQISEPHRIDVHPIIHHQNRDSFQEQEYPPKRGSENGDKIILNAKEEEDSQDASQNGSENIDTIYVNLSNMDGSASSPLSMLHTAKAKVNGLDVKILIDQGSNSSVATKNV